MQTGVIAASGGSVHVQFICGEFLTNTLNFTVLPALYGKSQNTIAEALAASLISTVNKGVHFHFTDWLGTRRVQTSYRGAAKK